MMSRNEVNKMAKGKLIVIEGACDGIGKSTQFELLKERLLKEGKKVICHHFPSYDLYQGLGVTKYLKGEYGKIVSLSPYFINNLYAYDRMITWQEKLKEAYLKGDIILLDRYTTSSLIYQSASFKDAHLKKQFIKNIEDFEYEKLGLPRPDMVLFLEAPFDLVKKMRQERNEHQEEDIHEKNEAFLKEVYESALFLADFSSWTKIKCYQKEEMKSIVEIHEEIYKEVEKVLK